MSRNYLLRESQTEWKGMTLDEIRYARIINELRIQMAKDKLSGSTQGLVSGNTFKMRPSSMIGRMLGALSWLDYGLIALRLSSKFSKVYNRKKK